MLSYIRVCVRVCVSAADAVQLDVTVTLKMQVDRIFSLCLSLASKELPNYMTSKIVFSIAFCSFPNLFLPRTHAPPLSLYPSLSLCLVRSVLSTHVGNFHLFVSSTAAAYISITNVASSRTSVKGEGRGGGGGGGETGHGLADVWNAKCVYDLWHVLCQINQMQSTVSAGLTELIRHVVPSPSLFPLPVPCTARGCCCCPLCQILDTCPGDTWTTSMKIQFPVENALTNQLFCVYSNYSGIFQARQH